MKKKVLYICSSLERCGPTNQLFNIVSQLHKTVYFHIITLSSEPPSSMHYTFSFVKKTCISKYNFFQKLLFLKKLARQYDIIQTQGIRADIISSLLFNNNIATLRNFPYEDYPALYGKLKGNLMAFLHLSSFKGIKKCITVSESNKIKLIPITNTKFSVIYNGVDLLKYKEKKITLSPPYNIIYSGPLIERKKVDRLLYIFSKLKNFNLKILGDGPLMSTLTQEKHNNIMFLGQVDNVSEHLSNANAFIMLSSSEGMPNAALEALAIGLPCILSNIPPHIDLQKIVGNRVKTFETNQQVIDFFELNFMDYLKDINTQGDNYRHIISSERMANEYLKIYSSM